MTLYAHEAQKALYAALVAANVCSGRVYDDAPQSDNITFPYVDIGTSQILSDDYVGSGGVDEYFDLHIWSRVQGFKEAREIADLIHTTLHEQQLTIAGRNDANTFIDQVRFLRDPDGRTRHAVVSVRVLHHT